MLKIFISFFVASVEVIAALILKSASLSQYIAALIPLLAFTVSIVSAFKEDIFAFQLLVLFNKINMARPSLAPHDSITRDSAKKQPRRNE